MDSFNTYTNCRNSTIFSMTVPKTFPMWVFLIKTLHDTLKYA